MRTAQTGIKELGNCDEGESCTPTYVDASISQLADHFYRVCLGTYGDRGEFE